MNDFIKEILEYTYVFNDKVIRALLAANNIPEKSLKLINHTVNAQEIWNARIQNINDTVGVWDIRPLQDLLDINEANYRKSLDIIIAYDLNTKVSYTNSSGKTFKNKVGDMLFHAINHSTYHRGQIASDFKANGITPIVTDYIFYKRDEI